MRTPHTTSIEPQFRTIDGLSIRYADSGGSGQPTVLLTSPWPESIYAFAPMWATLAEHARLFAVDLPGFGASERRADLLTPPGGRPGCRRRRPGPPRLVSRTGRSPRRPGRCSASSGRSASTASTCSGSPSVGSSPRRSRSCARPSSDGSCWQRPAPRERRGCMVGATTSPPRRGESKPENLLYIMFSHSPTSQAKGVEFLGRFLRVRRSRRTDDDAARDAQYDAIVEWGIPDHGALQRLTGIQSPTLILQGDTDLMIPPKVSHLMAGLIPNAEIRIYADAAHGFLFQYPADVARDVNAFLAQDHEEDRS